MNTKKEKVSNFDIMKEMSKRDLDIRFSFLSNISNMQLTKNRDTKITIGFPGDVLNGIYKGKLVGGFILCDKDQYLAVKMDLEKIQSLLKTDCSDFPSAEEFELGKKEKNERN